MNNTRRPSLVVPAVFVILVLLAPLAASAAGTASISGRVTASDGVTPLAGITVGLHKNTSGSWSDYGTRTTGTDGTYSFTGLINTTYAVEFSDAAGAYIPEYYDDKPSLAGADLIVLGATEDRTGIDASLAPASGISGTVRDSAGRPVAGIVVNAYRHLGGTSYDTVVTATATTASDGTYSLGGIAAGAYGLQLFSGAYASHYRGADATSGVTAISRATPVTVLAGQTAAGVDETMLGWGAIAGTVSGSTGPLNNVTVESLRDEAATWASQTAALTQSLTDGTFAATPLYPGRYRVLFTAPTGYPAQYHRSALSTELGADVVVSENATTQLDARLVAADSTAPSSSVSGIPAGWSNAITASLISTDGPSGSGVAAIHYWFDSDPASLYGGPFSVTEEGDRVLSYRAVDGFGNREETKTVTVMLDVTAPVVSSNATTAPYADTAIVDLSATDALSEVEQIVYRVGLLGDETSGTVVTLPVGVHALYYGARDGAGNWSGFTGPLTITVVTAPETPSDLVAAPTSPGAAVRLTWVDESASEDGFVVERARDTTSPVAFSRVATVGPNTVSYTDDTGLDWTSTWYYRVRAFNIAGQSGDAEATGIRLDTTAPTTSASVASTYTTSASITIVSSDSQSGVAWTDYQLDTSAPASGTVATTSALGSHAIKHRAMDNAGNLGDWSTPQYFVVVVRTYTLTYSAGAGGTILGTSPQTVDSGGSGTEVTAVANTGYHFTSWSDGVLTAARTDTNVIADKSVTGNFAIDTHTLTYSAGAGGSIDGSATQVLDYGSNGSAVTAVPNTGYHFTSWSDGVLTAARTDTNVTADKSVSASFAIDTHTLTYSAGTGGTILGTSPQTVDYGGSGTQVTAVPNTGYHFVKWSDNVMTAARTDTNVTANKSVTANFAIDTHTLTYSAGTHGTILGTSPQTVDSGGSGTQVTAVPNTGYHFVKWSDNVMTAARTDTNVIADKSVSATFAINTYTLTYSAGTHGTISGTSPQTVDYNTSGSAVTAVPNTGYHFVNWSDTSIANPRTDTNVTANKSVTANFAADTPTPTLLPVYRFYNMRTGVHFYTASEAEKANVIATLSSTYRLEGVAYYLAP